MQVGQRMRKYVILCKLTQSIGSLLICKRRSRRLVWRPGYQPVRARLRVLRSS